ncbi:lysophospholipid acyltransferase family protein [Roseibium marinum]|uniref:KDO2-lipid IV(A) lauroyltransferase n=1 Tax=Roseibium marinum TaxID=281252 RepID=A0A2S3UQX6_9HYPH|nr:lysophospholipid acyltransferase family protein [Roseibium marinum]POF29980.1 KDO2-lipid IV(A) lauroyltransferase [Roseibium marinum]
MSRKKRQRNAPKLTAFQNRVEGLALKVAIWLFRLIPVDVASYLMGTLWRMLAPFNPRHKRALRHLEEALPDLSAEEREAIVRGMWENLGRVTAETFHIDRLLRQPQRFEADVDEITTQVLNGERACLFVSFHSGNWELLVQPAVEKGIAITGVYQALRNPKADKALRALRQDLYKGGLLSKGHRTARKILTTLKNGGVVAMMGDLRETRGIQVPFFGRMAYATPVPASLARSCNVPIVLGRVIRKKGVNFRIEGRAISFPVTEDRQADIEAVTAQIHAIFESWIREYPEQWMWIHKKWAPPGKTSAQKQARRAAAANVVNSQISGPDAGIE